MIIKNPKKKKRLMMLTIAFVLTLYKSAEVKAYENIVIEDNFDTSNGKETNLNSILSTDNYFLIRIDGKTILTTRKEEQDEFNRIYKYYDIDKQQFVGQTLEPLLLEQHNDDAFETC